MTTAVFGYQTTGTTGNDPWNINYCWGYRFTAPSDVSTAVSISFRLYMNEAACTANFKGILVDAADLNTLVGTTGVSGQITDTAATVTATFASPPTLTAGHDYYIMAIAGNFAGGDASLRVVPVYDNGTTNYCGYASNSYSTPVAPGSLTANGAREYTSWCTYNVSGVTLTASQVGSNIHLSWA